MYYFLWAASRLWRVGLLAGLLAGTDFSAVLLSKGSGFLVQSAAAQAPTGSPERSAPAARPPVAAPVVEPTPLPTGKRQVAGTRALWVLGGGIVVVMGFVLFRILTTKAQAMPTAREDESARVRRLQHRRGQGRTPASREEQRISENSHDEFISAPMRQVAAEASEPKPDHSADPKPSGTAPGAAAG